MRSAGVAERTQRALPLYWVEDDEGLIEDDSIGTLYAHVPQAWRITGQERQYLLEHGLSRAPLSFSLACAALRAFAPATVLLQPPHTRFTESPAHRHSAVERWLAAQPKALRLACAIELERELLTVLDLASVENPKLRPHLRLFGRDASSVTA